MIYVILLLPLNLFSWKFQTFDGVKLFLPTLLPSKSTTCPVAGSDIKIIVTYKKKLDLVDREMIQQFNIIFKRIFNVLKFKMHNRNFYDPVSATAIKHHNLSIWPGRISKLIPFFKNICNNYSSMIKAQ